MSKEVVVFGGSGFLGSHVADALDDIGYLVTVYDSRPSPYLRPSQKMVIGNILDQEKVAKTIKGNDIVYNFAGIADIDEAISRPLECLKVNVLGNAIILDGAAKAGIKRFVFASSLYVYSKAGSFYRSSKQACELLIENYNEIYGLPYTILRYGSLYGSRANKNNFLHKIITQAFTENKITREGDGEEIREYMHILDAAKCSIEILAPEFKNQYVMIAGHTQMKMKDVLLMIREILGNKVAIEYRPAKDNAHYEITPYAFAPELAKRIVNRTYIDFGQGLLKYIQQIYQETQSHKHSTTTGRNKKRKS